VFAVADASLMYADLSPYDERLQPPVLPMPTAQEKAAFAATTKRLFGSWWERAKRCL